MIAGWLKGVTKQLTEAGFDAESVTEGPGGAFYIMLMTLLAPLTTTINEINYTYESYTEGIQREYLESLTNAQRASYFSGAAYAGATTAILLACLMGYAKKMGLPHKLILTGASLAPIVAAVFANDQVPPRQVNHLVPEQESASATD